MMMMMMMIEKSNEILLERELYRVGNDRRSNGKMIMIMICNDLRRGRMIQRNKYDMTVPNTSYYEQLRASEELTQIAGEQLTMSTSE